MGTRVALLASGQLHELRDGVLQQKSDHHPVGEPARGRFMSEREPLMA